jgi:predicted Zn-dependent protease
VLTGCLGLPACLSFFKATTQYAVPAIMVAEGTVIAARYLDDREEYYLGRTVAVNILKSYKLYMNETQTDYVGLVGKTVAMHSEDPETYGGYHFAILDSQEINAFACPGGIIFITKGLIDLVSSEDELAAVLAHEIAHVNSKDGMNSVQTSRWTQLVAITGAAVSRAYGSGGFNKIVGIFEQSVNDIISTVVVNGYSRKQEFSADENAVKILAASGYDHGAMMKVLKAYRKRETYDHMGFFKTHPGGDERIKSLEKALTATPYEMKSTAVSGSSRQARFAKVFSGRKKS